MCWIWRTSQGRFSEDRTLAPYWGIGNFQNLQAVNCWVTMRTGNWKDMVGTSMKIEKVLEWRMVQRKPLCFYCSTWHPWSKWSIIDIYTSTVLIRIRWYRGIFGDTPILELLGTDNIWQYTWRAPVLSQTVGSRNPFKKHSSLQGLDICVQKSYFA